MKGFRDFYPEDKRIQNYIFRVWRQVAEKFGYSDVEGPILEDVGLYNKSGEELPEQMYVFKDKGGRKVAIRPELTPTVARMVGGKSLSKPVKWYSIGRFLRYEAPQSGRLREFYQLNIDCFGSESMKVEAELIASAVLIMKDFGLSSKDFFIRISNRKLFNDILKKIGISKNFKDVARIVDKICRYKKQDIIDELKTKNVSEKQAKELLRFFSIKDIDKVDIRSEGFNELKELFGYLKSYGVLKYCKLDLSIVRGLDYYTGTVFEVFDASGKYRALAGGGRYDLLAKGYPAVGYSFGDVVLELFLKDKKKIPKLVKDIDYYVAPVSDEYYSKALKILSKLREKNSAEIDLTGRKLSKQLDYANKIFAKNVVIIGSDKKVTIKNMKTGKEMKKLF